MDVLLALVGMARSWKRHIGAERLGANFGVNTGRLGFLSNVSMEPSTSPWMR